MTDTHTDTAFILKVVLSVHSQRQRGMHFIFHLFANGVEFFRVSFHVIIIMDFIECYVL